MTFEDEVQVNDVVRLRERTFLTYADGYDRTRFDTDETFRVTRVYRDRLVLRVARLGRSFSAAKEQVEWPHRPDAERGTTARPIPRPLGQTPEGDHIAIDDPRVAWIWEDLGRYADGKNWCSEYDVLAVRMGIPGRPRDYEVVHHLAPGLDVRSHIRARSQREANDMLRDRVLAVTNQTPAPDSEPTPSDTTDVSGTNAAFPLVG